MEAMNLHCPKCPTTVGNVRSATCAIGHSPAQMIPNPTTCGNAAKVTIK